MRSLLLACMLALAPTAWAAGAPTGMLWHNSFFLGAKLGKGFYVSPLNGGAPIEIIRRSEMDVAVWPDGRQFMVTHYDVYQGSTGFVVMNPAGAALYQGQLDGYVRDVAPSPTDRRLALVRQGKDTVAPFEDVILDLATLKPRRRISDDDWFAWMPDGRFMLISIKTGRMRVASVDGAQETQVGQLVVPADWAMGGFTVSPTGKQFVMRMRHRSAKGESDLWIANIDGSGLEQFTDAKATTNAVWSPDGRYVAYKVDLGYACSTAGFCAGGCDQYYTPVELRKVRGQANQPGSQNFNVRDLEGRVKPLGCSVQAWTP
ncbi:MAG TPA: hypothetical protein VIN03_25925 [Roseateles sp.]